MDNQNKNTVCILPELRGISGPPNFQKRFIGKLELRGIGVHHHPGSLDYGTLFINGGTRNILQVYQAKKKGIRIVQRLNGMNWIHRKRFTGVRHFLRSEWNNRLLAFIRKNLADAIIYQSSFSRDWWQLVFGNSPAQESIIYNGVDLSEFSPEGDQQRPDDHIRVLLVEGGLGGGNEQGLCNAVDLADHLAGKIEDRIELMIVGRVPEVLKKLEPQSSKVNIQWEGTVLPDQVPTLDRSAHVLFSADLNAACPNSVIEALACGLPVVGYDTGALAEIVTENSGRIVPYGSNHWNLEPPQIEPLADAASEILSNQKSFRAGARKRAEKKFDLEVIVNDYLAVMLSG